MAMSAFFGLEFEKLFREIICDKLHLNWYEYLTSMMFLCGQNNNCGFKRKN